MNKLITREEAKARGLKRYYTGKSCKRGHVAERFVSDKSCTVCKYKCSIAWQKANPERAQEYSRRWQENNPKASAAAQRRHHHANKAKRYANYQRWLNTNREYRKEYGRKLYRQNPGKFIARVTAREHGKIQRTPTWADKEALQFFYECCPAGCHVDHIIPLHGERVSGLHVPENLQWLPAPVNLRKSNTFDI